MQKNIGLFRIFGVPISLHYTWFVVFGLVVWALASTYFPAQLPDYSREIYWIMGIGFTLLLFASVLAHELAHSYVALKEGIEIRGITLFIFGGVAQIAREPDTPKMEFKIAAAGPLCSFLLAGVFWGLSKSMAGSPVLEVGFGYLRFINLALAGFNLVPGFPLDGGRMFRAYWWHRTDSLTAGTRVASQVGKGFALLLMALGFFSVFGGDLVGGIWYILIGMFLYQAAESSYQLVMMRRALQGIKVNELMNAEVVAIDCRMSLDEAVDHYFLKYRYDCFPVRSNGTLIGMIALDDVKTVERAQWTRKTVGELTRDLAEVPVLHPQDDAANALALIIREGQGRLPVVEDDHLVGILTRRDIMDLLRVKTDLGE